MALGDTSFNGLSKEAPYERGTFFKLQLYERVEISLVEVYKRVEKSVISVGSRSFLYKSRFGTSLFNRVVNSFAYLA